MHSAYSQPLVCANSGIPWNSSECSVAWRKLCVHGAWSRPTVVQWMLMWEFPSTSHSFQRPRGNLHGTWFHTTSGTQWTPNIGISWSSPEHPVCVGEYGWGSTWDSACANQGITWSFLLTHYWLIPLCLPTQKPKVSTQDPLQQAPKAACQGICPGNPAPRKAHLTVIWPPACQTHKIHASTQGLSYTRQILQHWEREPFQLIQRSKHRKSYKLGDREICYKQQNKKKKEKKSLNENSVNQSAW